MNIIDMHCDTMYQIYERKREGKTIAVRDDANLHVTLEKMKQGGYLLQDFAAFVELEESKEQLANEVEDIKLAPYQFARHLIDTFKTQTEANQDLIGVVRSFADIQSNEKEGRMSALLTIEEWGGRDWTKPGCENEKLRRLRTVTVEEFIEDGGCRYFLLDAREREENTRSYAAEKGVLYITGCDAMHREILRREIEIGANSLL